MNQIKFIIQNITKKYSDHVKDVLITEFFKKPGPKKSNNFYKKIVMLYKSFPKTIRDLINRVNDWGYYNDLIYILNASKNESLNKYIYSYIHKLLKRDYNKYLIKNKTSTLAKWLPREKSKINKRLNFVDTLSKLLYPKIANKIQKRKKYRKLVSELNKYLNTAEVHFCNKDYDKIDPKNISLKTMRGNIKTIMENNECKDKFSDHLMKMYAKFPLYKIVKFMLNDKITDLEKEVLDIVWKKNIIKYKRQIKKLIRPKLINMCIVLDLNIKDYNQLCEAVGLTIIFNEYKARIIINGNPPRVFNENFDNNINENVNEIAKKILWNKNDYDKLDVNNILQQVTENTILVITDKTSVKNKQIKTKRDVVFWKLNENTTNRMQDNINILKDIMDNSEELNQKDKKRKYAFTMLIFISCIVIFALYYIISCTFFPHENPTMVFYS